MHGLDSLARQGHARVESSYGRIVPTVDRSKEDARRCIGVQPQLVHAGQVVGEHDSPKDRGDVYDRGPRTSSFSGAELLSLHVGVGGAEIDGLRCELLDAGT